MSRVVIRAHADGLGDALIYTTLPKLYVDMGHEVYISGTWRNNQVRDLVWGKSPYVSGFCNDAPTTNIGLSFIREAYKHPSVISAIEALHCHSPVSMFPEIHYEPRFRPEWANVVVADPRSISQPIKSETFNGFAEHVTRRMGYELWDVVLLTSVHSGQHGTMSLTGHREHQVGTLEEYCDIIHSCKAFLVAESGGQVLSSAILAKNNRAHVHALFTTAAYNDRTFVFPNIKYCVAGGMTPDFWNH